MKNHIIVLLLIVLLTNCQTNSYEAIPIFQSEVSDDLRDSLFQNRTEINMANWRDLLQLNIENVTAICSIKLKELEKSKIKNHELFILNGYKNGKELNLILTKKKGSNKVISYTFFDPAKLKIYRIYGRSNKIMSDGTTIEFIEDRSTEDNIAFYSSEIWIYENGEIENQNSEYNSIVTFEYLPITNPKVGIYEYQEDSLRLKLELRNGITETTYSYLLNYKMKNGCLAEINELKSKFGFVNMDTIGRYPIRFENENILIELGKDITCEGFEDKEFLMKKINAK